MNRTYLASIAMSVFLVGKGTVALTEPNTAFLVAQSIQVATRGFPCIVKLTIGGPAYAPKVSLQDELVSIRVVFKSRTNLQVYRIASSKGMDMTVVSPEGEPRDDIAEQMWQTSVSAGKQRSVLIDISSLRPEFGKGCLFVDVPPGEYDVAVELPGMPVFANTLQMKLVPPTDEEEQVLSCLKRNTAVLGGKAVLWNRFLGSDISLPRDKWDLLSTTTKEQTAFHILLANLLAPGKTIGLGDENAVKTTPLPLFLEPERECLLYEVKVATGKRDESEASRLMKQYPDQEWRLQDIKSGGKVFLTKVRATGDKGM